MDKETRVLFEDFIKIMQNLADTAEHIGDVENTKAVLVARRQHERLDRCLRTEQAYILKLRGLDQHRIRLTQDLGWAGLTFEEILEKNEGQEQEILRPLFDRLKRELERLQESREVSARIMNVRVYELITVIERKEGVRYDNGRKINPGEFPHTKLCDTYA